MISNNAIEDAVRGAVLLAGLNERVIIKYPNGPRPELPYTSIYKLTGSKPIDDWEVLNTDTNLVETYGYREFIFQLDFYGDNALDEASRVQGRLFSQAVRQALQLNVPCSILDATPLNNTPVLLDADFEDRVTFDITLMVAQEDGSTTDDLGYFDTVNTVWTNEPT